MELKVGDVVTLKTGGPNMTVNRVGSTGDGDAYDPVPTGEVETIWFLSAPPEWSGPHTAIFGAGALEVVVLPAGQAIGRAA